MLLICLGFLVFCRPSFVTHATDISVGKRQKIAKAAFFESRCSRQCHGRADSAIATDGHVPRSFIAVELGYGDGQGPSIEQTFFHLTETNERNRSAFDAMEGKSLSVPRPLRVKAAMRKIRLAARRLSRAEAR